MEIESSTSGDSFVKKLILIFVFLTITPLTLFSSVISLVAISAEPRQARQEKSLIEFPEPGVQVYASLPSNFPAVSAQVIEEDARPEIIRNYLKIYDSPLTNYADFIVETSDKYGIDWRLLTAIAQKESGLGRAMPEDCNNAWGYGIHSEGTLCFTTWEEAIETVSRGLRENYIDQGYVTVEEIMKKYANPASTTWAEGVSYYMSRMQ